MSSYWTPFSPSRESDYYRPNVTLNLDRPPRPGPRQPDCWRPSPMTIFSPTYIKQEDSSQSPDLENKEQTTKLHKAFRPREQVADPSYIDSVKKSEGKSEVNKRKVKLPKPPNPNKEPPARLRGGFRGSFYDGAKFEPETDQAPLVPSHNKFVDSVQTYSKETSAKVKPPKLGNPNLEQLGKRQMGVINSIMRVEQQKVNTTKLEEVRDGYLTTAETVPMTTEPSVRLEGMNEDRLTNIMTTDDSSPSTPENHERPPCRRLPYPRDVPPATPKWSRTMISIGPTKPVSNVLIPPSDNLTWQTSNSDRRQKLDFGNRIDQCLLKMDKWADAWLTNALTDEDPNPETDNAWNSFEYCLGMPDILEEGEIIEYEEAPRRALPVEVAATQKQIADMKRKRKWDEVEPMKGRERVSKINRRSWTAEHSMTVTLPSVSAQPEQISCNVNHGGNTLLKSPREDPRWRDSRESKPTEFRSSSSPEDKKIQVVHIPSAATLREQALRKLM